MGRFFNPLPAFGGLLASTIDGLLLVNRSRALLRREMKITGVQRLTKPFLDIEKADSVGPQAA